MKTEQKLKKRSLRRFKRELKTIEKMIDIYCKSNHKHNSNDKLCLECAELFDYAHKRLINCPFIDDKPVCVNCKVHCYRKTERQTIREIMKFSGPKMLLRHPVLAILHLIDEKTRNKSIS